MYMLFVSLVRTTSTLSQDKFNNKDNEFHYSVDYPEMLQNEVMMSRVPRDEEKKLSSIKICNSNKK